MMINIEWTNNMPIYKINESALSLKYGNELYESHEIFKNQKILLIDIKDDESPKYKEFLIYLNLLKKQYNSVLDNIVKTFNKEFVEKDDKPFSNSLLEKHIAIIYYRNKKFYIGFDLRTSKSSNDDIYIDIYVQLSLKNGKYYISEIAI